MVLTVKINFNGDIRRQAMEEVTYTSVVEMVTGSFPEISIDNLQMKYADEEGDMCMLIPMTFPDFLQTQSNSKVLKIKISKKETVAGSTTTTCDSIKSSETPSEEAKAPNFEDFARESNAKKGYFEEGAFEDFGRESWGHGRGCGFGGPIKFIKIIKAFREDGVLTPRVLASMTIQFLPIITQKITRKMDAINLCVKAGMSATMTAALLILQDHVGRVTALEKFAAQIKAIIDQEPTAPLLGDTLRNFLLALQAQAFETQMTFMEHLSEALLPLLDDAAAEFAWPHHHGHGGDRPWWLPSPLIHHGVICDHCGAHPIAGPRWKCTTCPNYDLCGNCFTQKTSIHGSDHDFQCIISEETPGWKGKGKGKAKGWKGCGKGFGKEHMWPHIMGHFWNSMGNFWNAKGAGCKGWGKSGHVGGNEDNSANRPAHDPSDPQMRFDTM